MGLFDFLGIKELQDPQDAAKEAEEASVPKVDQNQPIFQAKTLAEKNNMLKELKSLEEEEKSLTSKYGDFDPFNNSLEDFKAARAKAMENEASKTPATPLTAPWTFGQEVPKELGLNIRSSVSTTATPDLQTPIEDAEKLRKDEYEKALKRAEEGNLLATLLAASSQAGKAIAGEGRIDQTPDDFRSVAGLYGKDKRINEALKERADKDSKFDFEKAKHKDELAQKREWMQLQEAMHRENVEARKEMFSLKKDQKEAEKEAKAQQELDKRLYNVGLKTSEGGVSSRSPLGQAYTKLRTAERLDPILYDSNGNIKDKNKLNLAEAATGIASLIGGGNSPAQETINKFFPQTAGLSVARLQEWITNAPSDVAGSANFLKMYATIVENEKRVAKRQIKEQTEETIRKTGFNPKDPKIMERFALMADPTVVKALEEPSAPKGLGKQVVKKFYSKSADKTKFQYSDGTEEIVDGKQ